MGRLTRLYGTASTLPLPTCTCMQSAVLRHRSAVAQPSGVHPTYSICKKQSWLSRPLIKDTLIINRDQPNTHQQRRLPYKNLGGGGMSSFAREGWIPRKPRPAPNSAMFTKGEHVLVIHDDTECAVLECEKKSGQGWMYILEVRHFGTHVKYDGGKWQAELCLMEF